MGDAKERVRREKLITALVLLEEWKRWNITLLRDSKDIHPNSSLPKISQNFILPTDEA